MTSKFFGGTRHSYDREASLYQVCEGFGGPDTAHFTLTVAQQCAIIAAAATYAGKAYNPAGVNSVCTKTDIVQAFIDHHWLGAVKGFACGYFGDIFAGAVGVFVAGEASETGPGAVAVGVATYKALAGSLKLVCGGAFTAVGTPLGRNLETHHETAVMLDIMRRGKCLEQTKKTVIGIQWSAVSCSGDRGGSTGTSSPINLSQVARGDFSSLSGKWTETAYAYNPQNGTGEQWVSGSPSRKDTLTIDQRKLVFNASTVVTHGGLTYSVGNGPVYLPLKWTMGTNVLTASLVNQTVAINWAVYFYPKFPAAPTSACLVCRPNNGVKIASRPTIVLWTSSNGSTLVFQR